MDGDGEHDRLDQWLVDVRADDARISRQRERWLAQQTAENATLVGALVDLTESNEPVVVETLAGRRINGLLRAVGLDFCAIVEHNRWVLIPLGAVTSVRSTTAKQRGVNSDRPAPLDSTLTEALVDLLEERARLAVSVVAGEHLAGVLHNVGQDLVTLRLDGEGDRRAHVPLAAVSSIVVS
ncbi:MAG: hypothetical protein ACKVHU_08225 [Acidimicrobiales bacterium]|jgi:hypothetical protein